MTESTVILSKVMVNMKLIAKTFCCFIFLLKILHKKYMVYIFNSQVVAYILNNYFLVWIGYLKNCFIYKHGLLN